MWDRAIQAMCLALLTAAAGCSMRPWAPGREESPQPQVQVSEQAAVDFDEAVSLAAKLQFVDAEAKFSQLLPIFQASQDHARAAECTFWMGYCNEKQDRPERAEQFYRNVAENYPNTPAAKQAAMRLASLKTRPG